MEFNLTAVLSANLIRIRLNNKYSQAQIASLLSISQPAYNRIECGVNRISIESLFSLAKFYGVTIDDFLRQDFSLSASGVCL